MKNSERIALFKSVVAEERWLQDAWHRELNGKDYLCLAAAWGKPGRITSTTHCPTGLFPKWLFVLMPTLDDGVGSADVPWLFRGFAKRAETMATLSVEAWERIYTNFLVGMVRKTVEITGAELLSVVDRAIETNDQKDKQMALWALADYGLPDMVKSVAQMAISRRALKVITIVGDAFGPKIYRESAELLFSTIDKEL